MTLAMSAPALSTVGAAVTHPVSADGSTVAPMQTLVGGGTGTVDSVIRWPVWQGRYTSSGQLGTGRYDFYSYTRSATLTRSDGMTLTGPITELPRSRCTGDSTVSCWHADLAGTSDIASAHLDISLVDESPDRFPSKSGFLMRGTLTLRERFGYVMVDAKGSVYAFGGVDHLAAADTPHAVDIEVNRTGDGYWIVTGAGVVHAIGEARSFTYIGPPPALLPGERVTSLSTTPTGNGYWLFTSKGRVLPYGDAQFFGDLHTTMLNGGIVGSIATPTGKGYYMVGSDGGVFAFGDARFRGSMGNTRLNKPVVGLVPTADNTGYWLVGSDGGVFSFNAPFHGSMGATHLDQPVVTMVPYGSAYLMIARDGGVFNFSRAPFFGSEGGAPIPLPIVNGAAFG
jgi:hypothetical protein